MTNKNVSSMTQYLFSLTAQRVTREKPLNTENPSNFHICISPIRKLSRTFGLLPFTIQFDSNGKIEKSSVSVFDAIWFVTSIVLNLGFLYLILPTLKVPSDHPSSILLIIGGMISIIGYAMSALSIVFDMLNRKRITRIFDDLFAFDKKVKVIKK